MAATVLVLGVLSVLFGSTTIFLASEMMKKFGFVQDFIRNSNQMVKWLYNGKRKPGMYKIALRARKPFSVLVGFKLLSGFDYYGFVKGSHLDDGTYIVVISTYLGRGPCEFQFFTNCDLDVNPILASSTTHDQDLLQHETYPPHWWQRIGFFS
ncbi:MAG: hypothetical protein AAB431_00855 [Patescibacteria group bacterium]